MDGKAGAKQDQKGGVETPGKKYNRWLSGLEAYFPTDEPRTTDTGDAALPSSSSGCENSADHAEK